MDAWIPTVSTLGGIVVGWFLTQLSATRERKAADKKQERQEARTRALDAVECADRVAREMTSVSHGVHLRRTSQGVDQEQLRGEMAKANAAHRQMESLTVRVRVLGPDWLADPLLAFNDESDLLIKKATAAQSGTYTAEVSQSLQDACVALVARADELTRLANAKLGASDSAD